MLLLCTGPDTYRAQQKAHDLERAFIEKYDKQALSVDKIDAGKDAIDEVLRKADSVSLFNPRRFIRVDQLLSTCPKPKQTALINVLKREPDNVIVVSVEDEPLEEELLKPFKDVPKLLTYPFPLLSGQAFFDWLLTAALALGIPKDHPSLPNLARLSDGDAWLASSELLKLSAGGESNLTESSTQSVTQQAVDYLTNPTNPHQFLNHIEEDLLMPFLMQTRTAIRIRDNAANGLPSFFTRPWQGKRPVNAEKALANLIAAHMAQRQGFGSDEEMAALL